MNQLLPYTKFSIKAQVLLFSEFESYQSILAKKNDHESFYYIRSNDIPIMTNYIESRLGSRISDSSAIEFVTYIPSKEPLFILSEEQSRMKCFWNLT